MRAARAWVTSLHFAARPLHGSALLVVGASDGSVAIYGQRVDHLAALEAAKPRVPLGSVLELRRRLALAAGSGICVVRSAVEDEGQARKFFVTK